MILLDELRKILYLSINNSMGDMVPSVFSKSFVSMRYSKFPDVLVKNILGKDEKHLHILL